MYRIVKKEQLTASIYEFAILAERVAKAAKPGQFLIVRTGEEGERVPLTISDSDAKKGSVSIVVQVVGVSTDKISKLSVGESFTDVAGPLGNASAFVKASDAEVKKMKYVFIAGGVGAAPVYPQVKYLHDRGAHVDVILGARNKELIIMEKELSKVCDNLYVCTDDGSKGEKGVVTVILERLLSQGNKYDMGVAIGPMIMMKFVTLSAKKFNLPLTVSLNTLMVDGTGMCGACRVSVGGKMVFSCVDGPEFNAYDVDFAEAMRRQTIYRSQEQAANKKAGLEFGKK